MKKIIIAMLIAVSFQAVGFSQDNIIPGSIVNIPVWINGERLLTPKGVQDIERAPESILSALQEYGYSKNDFMGSSPRLTQLGFLKDMTAIIIIVPTANVEKVNEYVITPKGDKKYLKIRVLVITGSMIIADLQ